MWICVKHNSFKRNAIIFSVVKGVKMFGWLYRRVASGIVQHIDLSEVFLELTKNEAVQKQLVAMSDQLYERYKAKTLGSLGGSLRGTGSIDATPYAGLENLPIPPKFKRLLSNPLIGSLISGLLAKQGYSGQDLSQSSNIPKELQL